MRPTSQLPAKVLRQSTHEEALRGTKGNTQLVGREVPQRQSVDHHPPRLPFHFFSLAGQLIKAFTLVLECRVHRWNLLNLSAEFCESCFQQRVGERGYLTLGGDFAARVLGIGFLAQADDRLEGQVPPLSNTLLEAALTKFRGE